MRKVLVLLALATAIATPLAAIADDMAKPAGIRGEIIGNMMDAGGKIEELAGAIPAAKYTWRPDKGVRSVSEALLHVAAGNYLLLSFSGATPPMPMADIGKIETSTTDPAKVQQALKDSYAWASQTISAMSDADLDTQVDFFGSKMSKRMLLVTVASHSHEHLGQLIAYARTNHVTPPWTAREQAAAAAKKAAEAKAKGGKSSSGM